MTHRSVLRILVAVVSISTLIVIFPSIGKAQQACTPEEVDLIVRGLQAMTQAYINNDMQTLVRVSQYVDNNLSPSCLRALSQAAQQQQQYQHGGIHRPPSVYDHGGGTYSVPGVGACGPSGCVGY